MRVLTLNTWGTNDPYERRKAIMVAEIARHAVDICCLQEAFDRSLLAEIVAATGLQHGIFDPDTGLAIRTRWPCAVTRTFTLSTRSPNESFSRGVVVAVLEIDPPLMVACTHLSYRPEDASVRVSQVEEVLRTLAETSTSAPPRGETVQTIVAGDLNDTSDSPAIATLEGRGFVDTYHRLHPHDPSPTWAERNPFTALQDPQLPDRRIDYIFVDPRLAQSLRSCEIVLNLPDEAGVFPSDHFGVIAEFR